MDQTRKGPGPYQDRTFRLLVAFYAYIWYKKQLILVVFDMFYVLKCYIITYILYIFQCLNRFKMWYNDQT